MMEKRLSRLMRYVPRVFLAFFRIFIYYFEFNLVESILLFKLTIKTKNPRRQPTAATSRSEACDKHGSVIDGSKEEAPGAQNTVTVG